MKTVKNLILKIEKLKKKYYSLGFKKLSSNYLDKLEIIEIKGEWIVNIGEFFGSGETLENSLEELIYQLENFSDFKEILEKEINKIKKVC